MEKGMHPILVLLYKFSSRGLIWPALYGSVFGIIVLPLNVSLSSFIGIIIAYVLMIILPLLSPITFSIMLIVAIVIGSNQLDLFWRNIAIVLLVLHILRTATSFILVRKYPEQTLWLDQKYQQRR